MRRAILIATLALSVSACDFTAKDAARLLAHVNDTIGRVERLVGTVTAAYAQAEGVIHDLRAVVVIAKGEPHPCALVRLPLSPVADAGALLWSDAVAYESQQGAPTSWAVVPYGVGVAPMHTKALVGLCACLRAIHGGVEGYGCGVLVGPRQGWGDCGPTLADCATMHRARVAE